MTPEIRASYTDSFAHSFDAKGRITVPAEWRGGSFEERVFVLPSSDACLRVYPESWLGRIQQQISALKSADPQRKRMEDLAMLAQFAACDQQGRIMVKEKLRQGAGLKKDAMLIGRLDHFQIWDRAKWGALQTAPTTVEEALSAIGL
jgi:MraZ protein